MGGGHFLIQVTEKSDGYSEECVKNEFCHYIRHFQGLNSDIQIRLLNAMYLSGELREAPGGGGLLKDLLGGKPGRESAAGGQHGDRDVVK